MFDALSAGPRTAQTITSSCGTDARATEKLLNLLVTMRYLRSRDGTYRLRRHARRWLLTGSPGSVRDAVLMKRLEWRWIERLDSFIRDGQPLDVHAAMTTEDWGDYQRGMRAQANMIAPLAARQIPVPSGARDMLDVGGSHGYLSVMLCRRHPELRATVLDLSPAVEHAAPLLARERMGDRVVLRAGNVLTDDLGESAYDVILMFSLVHHFDDATNRTLVAKSARALRAGGTLLIGEPLRPASGGRGGQMGGVLRPLLRPDEPFRDVVVQRDAFLADRRGVGAPETDPAPLCPRDRPPGSGSRLGVSGVGHQWAVA